MILSISNWKAFRLFSSNKDSILGVIYKITVDPFEMMERFLIWKMAGTWRRRCTHRSYAATVSVDSSALLLCKSNRASRLSLSTHGAIWEGNFLDSNLFLLFLWLTSCFSQACIPQVPNIWWTGKWKTRCHEKILFRGLKERSNETTPHRRKCARAKTPT